MSNRNESPLSALGHYFLNFGVFLALGLSSVIVHEIGHAIAAIVKGVPLDNLAIGWYGLGPGVAVPSSFPPQYLPFFRYAGGLTAGLVCLLAYILLWVYPLHNRGTQKQWGNPRWWTGEFLLFWAIFELSTGYIEGAQFEHYISASSILQLQLVFIIAIPISLIVHAGVTLIQRKSPKPIK